MLPDKRLVATWSDTGTVHIWDITKHSITIDAPAGVKQSHKPINEPPLFSFSGHQVSSMLKKIRGLKKTVLNSDLVQFVNELMCTAYSKMMLIIPMKLRKHKENKLKHNFLISLNLI